MSRADRADVALAAGVALLGVVDVAVPNLFSTNVVGPRWFVGVCYVLSGLALAWSRRRPGTTFAVVYAVAMVQSLTVGSSEGNGTLFPLVIAAYSVAAHGTRRTAVIALAAVPVVATVREFANPQNTTVGDTLNALGWGLLIPAAWLLGAYLRTRRQLVLELQNRAQAAEREREERARTAVAEERARIARELHDVVAHSVSVMVVQAEAAGEVLPRDPDGAVRPLHTIEETGRATLTELRRLLGVLREDDAFRSPHPGIGDLERLLAAFQESGLVVDVETSGPVVPLGTGLDLAAFRIAQEALTNVLKHAGATRASLMLEYTPDAVTIEVLDRGRGPSGSDGGHGLLGMQERVKLYQGVFEAGPREGGGFRVKARLPVEAPT